MATAGRPCLLVISGLPGVGKSAAAAAVAARLGFAHLSVDPVENAMRMSGVPAGWALGVGTYEAVRAMAEQNLDLGLGVAVDAVNDSEDARQTWRTAAANQDAVLRLVVLSCSDRAEHRRRLEARRRGLNFVPEPSWPQVRERELSYVAWSDAHLAIDTASAPLGAIVDQICSYVLG